MADYKYSRYLYKPKKRKKKFLLALFLLILVGGGAYYAFFVVDIYSLYVRIVDLYRVVFNDYRFLQKNLEAGNYNVVIHEGLPYLEKRPYNARLMRYIGEAYYYIATALTGPEKEESIEKSIQYLRKGLVLSSFDDVLMKSFFMLGMSYFKKGAHYYELAVEYLEKALRAGYKDDSIYEIVGYCYYKLGVLDDAIVYLNKANEIAPKDIDRLFIAHAYKDKGLFESALKELDYLVENTQDDAILEEAYSVLVWIDFQEERYDKVRENIDRVLKLNENSAYAHFWLGNIYEKEGDLISARKEWRHTLKLNSKHIGAIEKLY
jgi:tetratricopeptide (TPR) repeat protein